MRKNICLTITLFLFLSGLLNACQSEAMAEENGLTVTVSVLPEKYFVERIGGEHVAVNVMVGPGESPHTYEPKPEQMAALSRSAIYFAIGVEFEDAWLGKIVSANPNLRVVNLAVPIAKIPITAQAHGDEGAASAHTEAEGTLDPHIWLSTTNARILAQGIYDALAQYDAPNQADYQKNLSSFLNDIDALEADMRSSLSNLRSRRFMVFHPAWGYLARDFGLEQLPIEISGSEPSAQELAGIIDEARHEGIRVIFAQPELSTRTAKYIADEIGGEVILISPLDENWLENMRRIAQAFADALE